MTAEPYGLLLPQPDSVTQPWWDAMRRHELAIQSCAQCASLSHPPRPVCAECGSEEREWRVMSGAGTIYSFVVVHRAPLPQWRGEAPYNIVLVSLDDAPHIRLHGNVVGAAPADLQVGLPVTAVFDDVAPDDTVLRWRLASSRACAAGS